MSFENSLKKQFSIPQEKTVNYSMVMQEDGENASYGIKIVVTSKKVFCEEETIENISTDKKFVENLMCFLYENGIDATHFKDIVDDVIANDELLMF